MPLKTHGVCMYMYYICNTLGVCSCMFMYVLSCMRVCIGLHLYMYGCVFSEYAVYVHVHTCMYIYIKLTTIVG